MRRLGLAAMRGNVIQARSTDLDVRKLIPIAKGRCLPPPAPLTRKRKEVGLGPVLAAAK
jgi:hypothetical protein